MRTVARFSNRVREIENLWIPLPDGQRLAARMWLPADAESEPVPAILEYLPYRKRDGTVDRDQLTHPYFAGHGYACLRVDIRGNGESDGLMSDEYTPQEQDDALAVIDWIAAQPWCTGAVGMIGISWGGFNGLQVAARGPAPLKAVITLCSTDDRYADDIHYKGGALLGENLGWGATMLSFSSRPPDPALVGERWREMWLERLEAMPLLAALWLSHQRRDAYWKQGSVCEDFGAITAAVLAVGGWGDAYSNAIPRLIRGLRAPARAIIGPWLHKYPHFAVPGPAIGFLQECLRWWDHWLKGRESGVLDWPLYRAYLLDSAPPRAAYAHRAGRWVAVSEWPGAETRRFALDRTGLITGAGAEVALTLRSPQTVGLGGGEYCAMWLGPESPTDQRDDDAGSLTFDSAPLDDRLEILGPPLATLELAVDRPRALLAVRLCDVDPGGASARVSFGILNLAHRDGHAEPKPLEPGKRYRITILLDDIAYAIPPGHRLRLAVSTAYWPMVWPSPEPVTLTLFTAASRLDLPLCPPGSDLAHPFDPPEAAPPLEEDVLRPPGHQRIVERDLASGLTTLHIEDDFGETRNPDHGLAAGAVAREVYRIDPDDPLSARVEIHWTQTLDRDDWRVRTEARSEMWADGERFHIRATLDAFEGETRVFHKDWDESIPRDHL